LYYFIGEEDGDDVLAVVTHGLEKTPFDMLGLQ
jgi:hypothetical protein